MILHVIKGVHIRERGSVPKIRAEDYTRNHRSEVRLKTPLKVHWTIPVNIHLKSDNPLEHTTDK